MRQILRLATAATLGLVIGVAGTLFATAALKHGSTNQPYADQQGRHISSLSAEDVDDLKNGKGWGLAKPAEFNGYPGPSHVIEFAERLELTDDQRDAVNTSFEKMQANAKLLGKGLIEAEAALDAAFKSKTIDAEKLAELLSDAEAMRSALRATHLAAHLEITPLLTKAQRTQYAQLRGYGAGHGGH